MHTPRLEPTPPHLLHNWIIVQTQKYIMACLEKLVRLGRISGWKVTRIKLKRLKTGGRTVRAQGGAPARPRQPPALAPGALAPSPRRPGLQAAPGIPPPPQPPPWRAGTASLPLHFRLFSDPQVLTPLFCLQFVIPFWQVGVPEAGSTTKRMRQASGSLCSNNVSARPWVSCKMHRTF